ncbi:hypothetical protein PYCH_03270 [Pyrococcus yayanosii CH1]|uniref:EamA domain-containing protein n=2 Tax=Pyrococcus TaxID=2260 RepID=F8AGP8_PYRYC|nr:hypothetical protein PYCH_03270 [Pyrococcus yayanosii CH1]
MLLYASLTSLTVFTFAVLVKKPKGWNSLRKNLQSAILGFLNPFLYYLVLFNAYSILPAQEAQALNYTWPLILTVFAWLFLSQPLRVRGIFGVFMGFLGALIVSSKGSIGSLSLSNILGDLLALSSALIWASYWVLNLRDGRKAEVKMFWNFLFGSLYILTYVAWRGKLVLDALGIIGSVYVGLFEMGVTFLLWLRALEKEEASKVAGLVYLTPVLSLFFITTIVREPLRASTIVGLALILMGARIARGRG